VEYADFCCLIEKGTVVTPIISAVTGPTITKLALGVGKILPCNFLSQNYNIASRFGTPACRMKVILTIWPKIGCHGNVP